MKRTIPRYFTFLLCILLMGFEGYAQIKINTPRTKKTNFNVAIATLNLTVKDAENLQKFLRPNVQVLDSANKVLGGFPTRFDKDQLSLNLPIYKKYKIKLSLTDYADTTFSYDLTGTKVNYKSSKQLLLRPQRVAFGLKISDVETGNDLPVNVVLNNKNRNEQIKINEDNRGKDGIYKVGIREKDSYEVEVKDGNNLSIYKGVIDKKKGTNLLITAQKVQGYNIYTVRQYKDGAKLKDASLLAVKGVQTVSLNVQDLETDENVKAGAIFTNKNRNEQIVIRPTDGSGRAIKVKLREGDEYDMEVNASKNYFFHTQKIKVQPTGTQKDVKVKLTKLKTGAKIALNDIYFDFNSAALKDSSFIELDRVVNMLLTNPKVKLSIEAHTDNVGSRKKNLKLSNRRAKSVADYLQEKKIDKARLVSRGFGEDHPLVPNTSEKNKAKNRRVELRVIKSTQ